MDLKLTEARRMMMDSAADFIKSEAPPTRITRWFKENRAYIPELYAKACELGWAGMIVPEEFGGSGATLTDCAVIYEALGHAPLAGPLFSSGVLATLILQCAGSADQQACFLPAIARGRSIVVPAITDKSVIWGPETVETRMAQSQGRVTLSGTKHFVLDAEAATHFICCARDSQGCLRHVVVKRDAPGVTVTPQTGFLLSVAKVRFDGVEVAAENVLAASDDGWTALETALEKALPILAAFKVGACQEIFDFTNEYTRVRVVFGTPIGRFQRVQDHCVDISIYLDSARWITYETLWLLDTGQPARAQAHETKSVASEAYYETCNLSHMVHAGPGTDYDHPLMAHSVLAHTLYQYLGTPQHHRRRMIDTLIPRQQRAEART
jgi:alkylation response protein AidB-like acyl-CoA dehydrogenase